MAKKETASEVIAVLREDHYGGWERVELLFDRENNQFVIRHQIWGKTDIIVLDSPEFISLLKAGLNHYQVNDSVVEKLASKLVQ